MSFARELAVRCVQMEELLGVPSVVYQVPLARRSFVWGSATLTALLQDFFAGEAWLDGSGAPAHYLGTLVLVPAAERRYWLADGQQRLAVVALTLAWLRQLLREQGTSLADELDGMLLGGRFGAPAMAKVQLLPDAQLLFGRLLQAPHIAAESESTPTALSRAAATVGSCLRTVLARGTDRGFPPVEVLGSMVRRLLEGVEAAVVEVASLSNAARMLGQHRDAELLSVPPPGISLPGALAVAINLVPRLRGQMAMQAAPLPSPSPSPSTLATFETAVPSAPAPGSTPLVPPVAAWSPDFASAAVLCTSPRPRPVPELLRPPASDVAHLGTVWIPRILWALEVTHRQSNKAVNASQIARVLTETAQQPVAAPNVARAFRSLRSKTAAQHLWLEPNKGFYQISGAGQALLTDLLASSSPVEPLASARMDLPVSSRMDLPASSPVDLSASSEI